MLKSLCLALMALMIVHPAESQAMGCPATGTLAVQVLGSGGPIADDGRSSAAYLVWIDGASRVLVDAGGGAFLRFGQAGARFDDLDFIGLSHFHTDHSADLPALLKSGFFSKRSRPLPIAGPEGTKPGGTVPFPGLQDFLQAMLDAERGAYAYLSGYLDGSGGLAKLEQVEVPLASNGAIALMTASNERFVVEALPVPHGPVPAIAFRLRQGDNTLVFASDQNGSNPAFVDFARGAGLLVMHMPIPQDADEVARRLHATPEKIGEIAQAAGVKTLLLSHFMARSLANLDDNVGIVRSRYDGHVIVAEDLACVPVP
jgi:ribonuclease BN (tRNA processing enzyme)